MRNICFILDAYPTKTRMANWFVENLVNAMADQNVRCFVISPQSVTKSIFRKSELSKSHETRKTKNGNVVEVFLPKYLTFSSKKIKNFNTAVIGQKMHYLACKKVLRKIMRSEKIDALYAHFIFPSAITAARLSKCYGIPYFFAYGENTTYTIEYMGAKKTREALKEASGVITVSSKNKRVLVENKIVPEEKITIIPNAINPDIFFKKDKKVVRSELGIPQKAFLVAFVGRFLTVKGPERLSKALCELDDNDIYATFIGAGDLKPDYGRIVFEGQLPPNDVASYLSASDVFVLPTLAEGCCNAIIEAMACGLPIVSSDMDFNQDILDSSNAVLIDPLNVQAIKGAIIYMKNNPKERDEMSRSSIRKARALNIENRAKKIISIIETGIRKGDK